jgi:hypothetical protein
MFLREPALNLFLCDSVRRTNSSTGSAVNAGSGVDLVDVAFCYAVNGTFGFARSACNAVVIDHVWHFSSLIFF